MQIKYMKGLSLLLATVSCIILMGGSNVFADTQAMKVSAKRVSSYSVTIPSTLSLTTTDKQNFTGTYTVGVKGDVAANDTVYLRPQNASFEMVGKADSNNKSTASVTQTKTEWSGSEIDGSSFTETTGDVEVEITHADEYEGNLVFEYGLEINLQPGLYDADNNLLLALTKEMVETNYDASYNNSNYPAESNQPHKNEYRGAVKAVIPDSVTTIGNNAFKSCFTLTSINIPDSVTSIGDSAFQDCRNLTNIAIPSSVSTIDSNTFNGCVSLTSINIPDSVTTIGNGVFANCSSLADINIPDSVISIDRCAFLNCTSLTNIIIPSSMTTISYATFQGCTNLTSAIISDGVATIDYGAFYYCNNLTSVTIPNSVTIIEDEAFYNCKSLNSITIPDLVTLIDYQAFRLCDNLVSVTYKGVEYTSKSALESALISNGVSVGTSAFSNTGLNE